MLFKSPIFRGLIVSKTLAQLIVVHVSIRRRSSHATNTSLLYKRLTRQRKVLNSRYALVSGKAEMQSLQEKASQWSGVDPADAFAIDSTNLFEKLGLQTFINLSTNFYTRVYDDEEEWFKSIFANSKKEEAIQNQYEFFIQRMGGPPLYSQRKGHPALIGRHKPFPVTHQAAERWLHHMQQALDSTPDIDADTRVKMMNFFRHTAFFLVAGNELKNPNQQVSCKHGASKPATTA